MVEFLVTCSLAVYLVALLYGLVRVLIAARGRGRAMIRTQCRKLRMLSRRARETGSTPDLSYYV